MADKRKTLAPVRPNLGIEAEYRRRIQKLIDEMHSSAVYWIRAKFKANPPEVSGDELPNKVLDRAFAELVRRWERKFLKDSDQLARYFATAIQKRSDKALIKILKNSGMTVNFKMTRAMRDVLGATVSQNVELIKSIPEAYLGKVQGAVMRSVQHGRDLEGLTRDIRKIHRVTSKRAKFIAHHQSNAATSALARARKKEVGIAEEVWLHSHAGKEPRPTHVKMDGQTFDINVGMWDEAEGRHVFPGELINCRCVSKPVIPGLD